MAVVVEFMTEPRWSILERLVEYQLRVRHQIPYQRADPLVLYEVVGVVVNLTGESMTGEWSMSPPDCEGVGLWTKARVCNLKALDARLTLEEIATGITPRCVLPWVALMRKAEEVENITEWKRLVEQETNTEKRKAYAAIALVFAEKAESRYTWNKALEDWNVLRSPLLMEREAVGERRSRQTVLLRQLRLRLQQEVPMDIVHAVESQEDIATLDAWLDRAIFVATWEEMRSSMGLSAA